MFDHGNHILMRRDGVCVVLKTPDDEMPQVEYWGRDWGFADAESALAALDAMTLKVTPPEEKPDAGLRPSLLPQGAEAFAGRPGLEAHRAGAPVFVRWTSVDVDASGPAMPSPSASAAGADGPSPLNVRVTVHAEDGVHGVALDVTLTLERGGLLVVRQRVADLGGVASHVTAEAVGEEPLTVNWLDCVMPIPRRANHLTQFTGRWPLEKQPSTTALPVGSVTRDCRHGKTSHESPWMFIASDGEPQFSRGEVWACHLAWSGNQTYGLDNLPQHEPLLGAGELLGPGEVRLAPGESYTTPEVCFSWSDEGLDGMSARFHEWLRTMPGRAKGERPVTLNTWEAVYFDHDEQTLLRLADVAARGRRALRA